TFLHYLFLPALLCIGLNVGLFTWLHRNDLNLNYATRTLVEFNPPDARFFRFTFGTLVVISFAYVLASEFQIPLSFVALGGALVLLVGAVAFGRLEWAQLRREISWSLFIFISGLFLLVRGVESLGLTAAFGQSLLTLAGSDPLRG